jgi:hypothetical protein
MLVYSGTIWLSKETEINSVLSVVANWLSRKIRSELPIDFLKTSNQKRTAEGMQILISRAQSTNPFLECIRLTHPDADVRGRQWVIEIGIKRENISSEIECSILSKTEEISPRVEGKIQPTVPFLVHNLIKQCSPSAKTFGLSVTTLDNYSETEAFGYSINNPDRRHPFVLVSPTLAGEYLVNIDTLRFFLEGIAEVVVIPVGADTFRMQDVLGSQYIAYGGAVNIIFPEVNLHGNRFSPNKRLNPDFIYSIEQNADKDIREREILSIITHRTNLPNSWRHISFEKVNEQIQRDERKRLREQAKESGETTEYVALLESENADLEKRVAAAENISSEYQVLFNTVDDENRQLHYQIEGLELSLSHVNENTTIEIPDYIQNILDTTSRHMTPKESLSLVSKLFADRLVVLDTAWKSSSESDVFREKKKAFELLWKLSTAYWNILADGKSDSEAKDVFGKNEYASNEGEVAGSNKRARLARTFEYKGENIEMMKHLKYGIKDSASETIRIHFEWDSKDKKIVIGHCGPHLPHK